MPFTPQMLPPPQTLEREPRAGSFAQSADSFRSSCKQLSSSECGNALDRLMLALNLSDEKMERLNKNSELKAGDVPDSNSDSDTGRKRDPEQHDTSSLHSVAIMEIMEEPPSAASTVRAKREGSSDSIMGANAHLMRPGAQPAGFALKPKATHPFFLPPPLSVAEIGVTLEVGIPCIISSKRTRFRAFARYIGEVAGELGPWVGIEVPIRSSGGDKLKGCAWHDGTWGGIRYFEMGDADWGDAHRLDAIRAGNTMVRDMHGIEQAKRCFKASSAMSDVSAAKLRGLFVRPQQVLYVIDTEQR